jgi:methylmalonyl-CoA mutase
MTKVDSPTLHAPANPVRFISAASLFDGHDAAINIMRRILQAQGAEVIHLGHNRSVNEVVRAAIQEDVQGIALSSYQGGHVEYFKYLVDQLAEHGRSDIKVYGGGGGVIVPAEIAELEAYGVAKIFSPQDGQRMGLGQMINQLIAQCDVNLSATPPSNIDAVLLGDTNALARAITCIEAGSLPDDQRSVLEAAAATSTAPVLGITGTGGSGKSSLTDELIRRFRLDQGDKVRICVIAVDPSKRTSGGALLGDRIRMNAIDSPQIYFRSLSTRGSESEVPPQVPHAIVAAKAAGFDLVIVETPGIGQGNAAITDVSDVSLYVMTPEFGAASQLEKIDMLDLADAIAINKFDRRGAEDAYRSVCRQWARVHLGVGPDDESVAVYGTVASRFNDVGTTALYQKLRVLLEAKGMISQGTMLDIVESKISQSASPIIPADRTRYLAEIATTIRSYHANTENQAECLSRLNAALTTRAALGATEDAEVLSAVDALIVELESKVTSDSKSLLSELAKARADLTGKERLEGNRTTPLVRTSLSGTDVPRVALPTMTHESDLYRWSRKENLPGHFPFTAGVFPFKREGEDPARMFAGEGDPARTNRRFHMLSEGQPATRLSTAFDSVTLYGRNPGSAPDVYGKIGTSGVSIATLEDMKTLYSGFDLCSPSTSVSMTINGPAPTILAMFINTAIDQQMEKFEADHGRKPSETEASELREAALKTVRGTVQADILKEDQGQNTCIFSTEFSLAVMADIQEYFIEHDMKNFYSVSISGYHIAEAGANPITQLAFTLANGFTYVESYLARGMSIDDFAANLSFFFSNGMDPEYTVIGRVARRIWAVAMRERYNASEKSQKLKYHIQTSGRSLHAQEMAFNDIRTTLQALCAIYDNANSLHTNAYDEAVTTPSEESVRRALAIQLIINREWGLAMNENPLQGSFIVEELTDLVEASVLAEMDRISDRGGVLGAMETGYQRGRIQDDSMLYEHAKHDGSLPIIGVNTFRNPTAAEEVHEVELARATESEKQGQLDRLEQFHNAHAGTAQASLTRLRDVALNGGNIFAELVETVRVASLGQITDVLFEVGGTYRRNV